MNNAVLSRRAAVAKTSGSFRCRFFVIFLSILAGKVGKVFSTGPDKVTLDFKYEFAHLDGDPERAVSYFREDIMVIALHMNYHYAQPYWSTYKDIMFDRAGEQFGYYHQQLEARYDCERISVGLPLVKTYSKFSEPIAEAYYSSFPLYSTKYNYRGRMANTKFTDVPGKYTVATLTTWEKNLVDAIQNKYIIHHNGSQIRTDTPEGHDLLGLVVQSTAMSPNHKLYGCFDTAMHVLISRIGDPNTIYYAYSDVAASIPLTVSDPFFYRYHKHMDNRMQSNKDNLPRYQKEDFKWDIIKVHEISLIGDVTNVKNQVTTYTEEWKPILKHGFDFLSNNSVRIQFKILQNEGFSYELDIENNSTTKQTAVVRIFLGPIADANGVKLSDEEQRRRFIELDKFIVDVAPGRQKIGQYSKESSVAGRNLEESKRILAESPQLKEFNPEDICHWPQRLFDQTGVDEKEDLSGYYNDDLTPKIAHRNCAWPQHLLIPRGNKAGVPFTLYVIVTDWQKDKARPNSEPKFLPGSAYCGVFNTTYPDKRSMGFPFDRRYPNGFTPKDSEFTNVAKTQISIFHSDIYVEAGKPFTPPPSGR